MNSKAETQHTIIILNVPMCSVLCLCIMVSWLYLGSIQGLLLTTFRNHIIGFWGNIWSARRFNPGGPLSCKFTCLTFSTVSPPSDIYTFLVCVCLRECVCMLQTISSVRSLSLSYLHSIYASKLLIFIILQLDYNCYCCFWK